MPGYRRCVGMALVLTGLLGVHGGCPSRRRAPRRLPAAARVGVAHRPVDVADSTLPDYRCPPKGALLGHVVWRPGRGHLRRYWAETDLSKVVTSKDRPVEVCGVMEQLRWLMAATCPDGSHPFSSPVEAHQARVGNVGLGGRCGTSVVDLYRVPCPGRTFYVYMDLYECEQGRTPFDEPRSGGGR